MEVNKNAISVIVIFIFLVAMAYFIEPAKSEDVIPDL